jgi:hypothetical protein
LATGGPYLTAVDSEFLRASGAQLVRGRFFGVDADNADGIVVVNQTAARTYWPDRAAVGECLFIGSSANCVRVIGIIRDIQRESLIEGPTAQLYVPVHQAPVFLTPNGIFIRTEQDPVRMASTIERAVMSANVPGVTIQVRPLIDLMSPERRFWFRAAALLMLVALAGVSTATAGVFGLSAYVARARRRELAIRSALGCSPGHIVWIATARTVRDVGAGMVSGAAVSAWVLMRFLPAGADAHIVNWPMLVCALIATLVAAVLASALPACAETRVDARILLSDMYM